MLREVMVPSATKDLVELSAVEYVGWGPTDDPSSFHNTRTYIDAPAWNRLMTYTRMAAENMTFDMVLNFTRSLMQHIVINKVVISDGRISMIP
ncbi:hypothetical protein INT48_006073 [Thamnidium elegans]|uniref:Uncharacterized protein n=1 Tax=Thamnidium elegans TaxID=101142 RepID=A0A8H7SG17_9FUNG|nr:hypothetical protein INT48_006073 [Thamnidium elegans]